MNFKYTFLLAAGMGLMAASCVATVDGRYATIMERNAFALRGPQIESPKPQPPELLNVTITGLSEYDGEVRAYFSVVGKANAPARFVALREGEMDGELKLVRINEEDGEVEIRNTGMQAVLKIGEADKQGMPGSARINPVRSAKF